MKYNLVVAFSINPLVRFFAVSLALHVLTLGLLPKQQIALQSPSPISVTILPSPPTTAPKRKAEPKDTVPLPRNASASIGKERSKETSNRRPEQNTTPKQPVVPNEQTSEPAPESTPPPETSILAERNLPTLKDLLPSLNPSATKNLTKTAIPLNSKDPTYVTYNGKLAGSIDRNWHFPELALLHRLKGTLVLEFTISARGRLQEVKLVRSSGFQLLDEEAMRAIRAAAPYPPFPPWIKEEFLVFSATMEYYWKDKASVGLSR